MSRTLPFAFFVLTACGAAPSTPVANEATATAPAPASRPAPAQAASPASASGPSAPSDDEAADTSAATDDAPPSAPAVPAKTVEKPLPNTPFFVTVPVMAVLKKGDGDLRAEVNLSAADNGHTLIIQPRLVMFMPLDEELKDLAKDKMKVVSTSGSGEQYSIVYRPYPNMFTYMRHFSVGGKNMSCFIEGLYRQDDLPAYDAICKSVQLKKR